MKIFILCIILLFVGVLCNAQNVGNINTPLKPGDKVPNLFITGLMNSSVETMSLHSMVGRIVMLDFWATWCTPCIQGFSKMEEIQKKFGDKVQIIAISDEMPERLSRFIKNRPVNFWVASDTSQSLKKYFPHISIPHIVIIDADGTIQAITYADEVNEQVVAQVLNGIKPAVSFKDEKEKKNDEVFARVQTGEEFFGLLGFQPGVKGLKAIEGNSIRYINMHFSRFFLDAYNINSNRLRYENIEDNEQKHKDENKYSLYVAIKENNYQKLMETLKQKLHQEFVYQTRIAKEKDTVFILKRIGEPDNSMIKPANSIPISPRVIKGKYHGKNKAIGASMAEYLELFGILDGIVLDETEDKQLYDIEFTWEPERAGAVDEFLNKLGIKIERAVREYDVLIIYKQ